MTAATIVAAFALLGAEDDDQDWSPRPLRVGDVHRIEMAEDSRGENFVRNPQTNAVEKFSEELSRRVVYRQRLLANDDPKAPVPFRALCLFEKLESKRQSKDKTLTNFVLRDEVKLLALDPRAQVSRAWSPRGPLLWSELHTVSYLVFVPALNGLLPEKRVRWGDKWQPTRATLEHLSTLTPLREANVTCECRNVREFKGERLLTIAVTGTVIGDDPELGRATDTLDGGLYIRPADGTMHSLNLRARRRVVDDKGGPVANWDIEFRLGLRPADPVPPELSAAAAEQHSGAPTPAQLALIAPYPQAAAEVTHPRTWRPNRAAGTNFELYQANRNERMEINFEVDGKTPTIEEYCARVKADFAKTKGPKLLECSEPTSKPLGERGTPQFGYSGAFVARVDHGGVERLHLYLIWQRGERGATAMVTCAPADFAECSDEAKSIMKSLRFTAASLATAPAAEK